MRGARRFEVLDGYRGLAAVAVLCGHATLGQWLFIAPHCYLAVDFFFMLSGFVIAAAYERRLSNGLSVRQFAARRLARLYPMIALGTMLGAVFALPLYDRATLTILVMTGLLLIPTPLGSPLRGRPMIALNPFAWSLLWEIVFNILYAAALPRLTNRILTCLIVIAILALAPTTVVHGSLNFGASWSTVWAGALRTAYAFPTGVLLFRLWAAGRLERMRSGAVSGAAVLLACFCLPRAGLVVPFADLLIVTLVFPMVLATGANAAVGRGRFACGVGGRLSYPLYILQGGVYPVIHTIPIILGVVGWAQTGTAVALMLGYALFAHLAARGFDEPVQRKFALRRERAALHAELSVSRLSVSLG